MAKLKVQDHILVPKHAKISEKEKEELLNKYHITLQELPKILKKDPAIKELSVKVGDIIKVERNSQTAGKTVFYRCVVNG